MRGACKGDFEVTLQPAIAAIPTITEIGMAALLPRANQSAKVVSVGSGKLGLEIGGTIIKDRKDRIAFLKATCGRAGLRRQAGRPAAQTVEEGAGWHSERHNCLDYLAGDRRTLRSRTTLRQARRQMDGVLNDLRRGIRVLRDLGVKHIILAADHGHLFGEEVGEDMKIEAPGGDTADLHRRVWVGVGGTSDASYLRTSLASLGHGKRLDIATPWTFACFKAKGGARAYFHGGLSPQELIVPVVDDDADGPSRWQGRRRGSTGS